MAAPTQRRQLPAFLDDALSVATGRAHRADPVLPPTGGPAGNASLTAWTGLVLLGLSLAELVTLLDVTGLISWHVVIGTLLIPPALVKTATTGWRVVRYYRGNAAYAAAGPPPLVLRVLGPAVVASTLSLLGSGLVLVYVGAEGSRSVLVSALGVRVDWVTLHQAAFAVWAVATGLHVLGRFVPALRLTVIRPAGERGVPGVATRVAVLVVTGAVAVAGSVLVLSATGSWGGDQDGAPGAGSLRGDVGAWSAVPARSR